MDFSNDIKAMRRLWAAKLLIHARDYALGVKWMGARRMPKEGFKYGDFVGESRRAYAWMCSEEKKPGSFNWICEIFDLQPERTRRMIMTNWRQFLNETKSVVESAKRFERELEDDLD